MSPDLDAVRQYLLQLQERICRELGAEDGQASFSEDVWTRPAGGGGRTRTLSGGAVFEKAGVAFSEVSGTALPPSATAHRPELAGKAWIALGVSVVVHPLNPYVPTSHANVRFFVSGIGTEKPVWWFGGGFDLTPYYGFNEDASAWHRAARAALEPFGSGLYPKFKQTCDEYFVLKHRGEARGIGGVFFDDLNEPDFATAFSVMQAVGNAYLQAYLPIVRRRKATASTDRERQFQLYRRGRYVEFNLVWDRGTLFGLQSGGRTESILMSLPPLVRWDYGFTPEAGSAEAKLTEEFLRPRDWANL